MDEIKGTIVLTVAYDGSTFAGFARQDEFETVQGRLEDALATVLGHRVQTVGAGRTDSGVHALGQVVSLETAIGDLDELALSRSLTALAGPGIVVRDVRRARLGFSARFDAVAREYRYRIVRGAVAPVFLTEFSWWLKRDLDLDAMREGGAALVGEHDFKSFCVTESARDRSTTRRVEAIEIFEEAPLGEECVVVRILGNAFLHSMVRTVVGTLVEVGLGRRTPSWVGDALAARNRAAAGQTAPAHGLTLWSVSYPDDVWL